MTPCIVVSVIYLVCRLHLIASLDDPPPNRVHSIALLDSLPSPNTGEKIYVAKILLSLLTGQSSQVDDSFRQMLVWIQDVEGSGFEQDRSYRCPSGYSIFHPAGITKVPENAWCPHEASRMWMCDPRTFSMSLGSRRHFKFANCARKAQACCSIGGGNGNFYT